MIGCVDLQQFIQSIQKPRKIIILVKAGKVTEYIIDTMISLLEKDDIIIDGGNANWNDTIRREKKLNLKGLHFIGLGISGGEEGARFGPSLMPGGDFKAWQAIQPICKAIAAKVDNFTGKEIKGAVSGNPIKKGTPCAAYIGKNGAGHYVKMIHNGIEYADLQMICEAYHLMKKLLNISPIEMSEIFLKWNKGVLNSFLIEIAGKVLKKFDVITKKPFVDIILDVAGQKETGKWTSINALNMNIAAPTILESVFARCISSIKEERKLASNILNGPNVNFSNNKDETIQAIHDALYSSKICAYAQGYQLMQEANNIYKWQLNFGKIAEIWRGGCIIRAAFLQKIIKAFEDNNNLTNLLVSPYFKKAIDNSQNKWRKIIAAAVINGIPVPAFSSALTYFDSYRTNRLPQNLLQGIRDYFGSHTYERIDQPRGKFFHINWLDPIQPENEVKSY